MNTSDFYAGLALEKYYAKRLVIQEVTRCAEYHQLGIRSDPFEPPVAFNLQEVGQLSYPGLKNVPRCLYRVHVDPSVEYSPIKTTVQSVGPRDGSRIHDICQIPREDAANFLASHLGWEDWSDPRCSLTTWTGSLLVALQYAKFKCSYKRIPASKIFILCVDTSRYPLSLDHSYTPISQSFASSTGVLIRFASCDEVSKATKDKLWTHVRYRHDYEFKTAEYFSQGYLDIRSCSAQCSLEKLEEGGLNEICPLLVNPDNPKEWLKRLRRVRRLFGSSNSPQQNCSVSRAFHLGEKCFGPQFGLFISTALLAIQTRTLQREDIGTMMNQFAEDMEFMRRVVRYSSDESIKLVSEMGVPEFNIINQLASDMLIWANTCIFLEMEKRLQEWDHILC